MLFIKNKIISYLYKQFLYVLYIHHISHIGRFGAKPLVGLDTEKLVRPVKNRLVSNPV